jgi:hypothetical protein
VHARLDGVEEAHRLAINVHNLHSKNQTDQAKSWWHTRAAGDHARMLRSLTTEVSQQSLYWSYLHINKALQQASRPEHAHAGGRLDFSCVERRASPSHKL